MKSSVLNIDGDEGPRLRRGIGSHWKGGMSVIPSIFQNIGIKTVSPAGREPFQGSVIDLRLGLAGKSRTLYTEKIVSTNLILDR